MSNKERIHSDFETIKREDQEYRISTYVKYFVDHQKYQCKGLLFKSHNGRVLDARRDRMHKEIGYTSDKSEIDDVLEDCIETCREKLNEIEDAKDVSVEVSITDE